MIDYGVFQFAAPPGTGVAWSLRAMQAAGLGPGFRGKGIEPFLGEHNKLRVSLVTYPLDWLYRMYLSFEINGVEAVDVDSFSQFFRSYLSREPFTLKSIFSRYKADTILRLEDMPWALEELLEAVGSNKELRKSVVSLKGLEKYPVVNSDRKMRELYNQLKLEDREFFEQYDYY